MAVQVSLEIPSQQGNLKNHLQENQIHLEDLHQEIQGDLLLRSKGACGISTRGSRWIRGTSSWEAREPSPGSLGDPPLEKTETTKVPWKSFMVGDPSWFSTIL